MDILFGTILLAIGLAIGFAGLRLWFILLPFLGFFAGLSIGVGLMYWIFDEGLFATATGLVIGFFIGLVFAVLSYLFWYVGALLGAAYIGGVIGAGFMRAINVDSNFAIAVAAILAGVAMLIIAVIFWLPVIMVIINSAIAGATWAIAGVMLIFNVIDREHLSYGTVTAAIDESWFWVLALIMLSIAGIIGQLQSIASVRLPEDRWTRVDPTATAPA